MRQGSEEEVDSGPAWNLFAGSSAIYRRSWVFYMVLGLAGAIWTSAAIDSAEHQPFWRLLFNPQSWHRDLGLGLAIGLGLALAWLGLRQLPWLAQLEQHIAQVVVQFHRSELWALCALSAFAEELFFRGAMQEAWCLWPSALVFGLAHLAPGRAGFLWALLAATAGVALGALYASTGTLLAPIAAHASVNVVNLARMIKTAPANHREVQ